MYRNLIVLFTILLFSLPLAAQQPCNCEQAEQLRPAMGMHFNSGRLDSAAFYTAKLLQFKEKACSIYYQNWMAQIAISKKEFASARNFLETEKNLLQTQQCNTDLYVRHYNTLGRYYQELNFYDSLVTTCLLGIDASQNAKDYYGLSRANADLAAAFAQLDQHEKTIYYYRQAADAAKKQTRNPALIASVQTRLGNEYLSAFNKSGNRIFADSAAMLAKEALDTASKYHDLIAFLEANDVLAKHALLTGDNKAAIIFADVIIGNSPAGIHLFDRHIYSGYSSKSEALFKLNDFKRAEQFADSALVYGQAFNPQMAMGAYEKVYQAAKATGNMAKSQNAFEKMTAIKDSLFTMEKNKSIAELEKKYNQAKNEKTIKELDQQKKIYLLLAVAGLLALIAIAFFIRQQSLKHKQKILETEQRLNRARMNPHFFFNALASLQSFAMRENDGKALASNLSKFSHIMRETLESSYHEYVSIEQEIDFLNEYLSLQQIRFPKKFSYEVSAEEGLDAFDLLIPSMIIQPFAENSIEHGFADIDYPGHLKIHFSKKANDILIDITDNGQGLITKVKEHDSHISRASQIIKDRIYLLNIKLKTKASFSIDNAADAKGVIVKINLPVIDK